MFEMKLRLMDPVITGDAIVQSYQYQVCQSHTDEALEVEAHKKNYETRTLVCCVEFEDYRGGKSSPDLFTVSKAKQSCLHKCALMNSCDIFSTSALFLELQVGYKFHILTRSYLYSSPQSNCALMTAHYFRYHVSCCYAPIEPIRLRI